MFLIILLCAWQGVYYMAVDVLQVSYAYQVPSPVGIGECLVNLCEDGELFISLGYSVYRCIVGYIISVAVGMLIGLMLNRFKFLADNLRPVILGIQTLPSVCWIPFAMMWFGLPRGILSGSILFVIIMGSSFGISISVYNSIKNVQPIYKMVAETMGTGKNKLYMHVILPACLPELIAGLKHGWSFAWRALMAGEVMTTCTGIGQTLVNGRDLNDINQVALVMIVIVVVGIVVEKVIFFPVERRIALKRGLEEAKG